MNKSREIIELALGTADVQVITPDNISSVIADAALHEVVISQIFTPINDFDKTEMKTVVIPNYKNYISVTGDIGQNTTVTPSSFSYEGTTVNTSKLGIRIEINNEAIKSTKRNLLTDALYMSSKVYADELDKRAETVLLDLHVGSITSWSGGTLGTVTAGQSPIIQILTVGGTGTIDAVDYYDGKISFNGSIAGSTVTFTYSDNRTVKDSSGKGTLKLSDILDLKGTMNANTIYPDMLFINPIDMTNFVKDTLNSLFSYMVSNNNKPLTGNIGRILDMNVISSGIIPVGAVILVDSSKVGYKVTTRELTGKQENRPEIDSQWYHLWSDIGYGVYNTLSIGIITNLKTGQYPATNL